MTDSPAEVTPQTVSPDVDPALAARYAGAGLVTYVQPFYNLQTGQYIYRCSMGDALPQYQTVKPRPATFYAPDALAGQGVAAQRLLVTPAPLQTLLWRVVALPDDAGSPVFHEA